MIENLLQEAEQARNLGNDEKAAQIYQEIIKLCSNDELKSHYLAFSLQELAQIYADYGQPKEAIPLYQQLIALGGRILGADHPDIISAIVNLARAYEADGNYSQADDSYKLATSKAEAVFGIADPMAQDIRQEFYDTVVARQVIEDDKLRHGLTLTPASPNNPNSTVKPEEEKRSKKYSNLRQPTKIKKLRYVAESVEEQSRNLLKPHGLKRHGRDIFYIVSVVLCVVAILIALSKLFVPNELPDNNLIAQHLIGAQFGAADGNNGIRFIDNKYAVFTNDVHHRKIPYFLLKGGMSDLKDMILSMAVRKEIWYQINQDELTTEDGNVYYASGAPEVLLVKKMQALADFAKRYYALNGCYPDKSDKLKDEPGLAYINPFDDKADLPVIRKLSASYARDAIFQGLKTDTPAKDCYLYLRHGGCWRDDLLGRPGKISALALFTSQRCADGYKVAEFYIHGFDRHGKLITAGKPETTFAIGLYLGANLNDDNQERIAETDRASIHPPERIYIEPGDTVDLHFWRQFLAGLLLTFVVLSFIAWIFIDAKKRGLDLKRPLEPLEIVFLISFSIWAYITVIHLIP